MSERDVTFRVNWSGVALIWLSGLFAASSVAMLFYGIGTWPVFGILSLALLSTAVHFSK